MPVQKIGLFSFVCLLIFVGFADTGFGYTTTVIFVPAGSHDANCSKYYDSATWTKEVGYAPSSAGANVNTGYVGVYSSAWVGGADSEAWQCIRFQVPYDSAIRADVNIAYAENAVNVGYASFSGTAWQWQLDSDPVIKRFISHPFEWDVVVGKILEILAMFEFDVKGVGDAIEVAQGIMEARELAEQLDKAANAGKAEKVTKTFWFTADAGAHQLWVGLRGEATGFGTGSGFSVMFGQIQQIKLTINNGYSGPPDLIVQSAGFTESIGFYKYYPLKWLQRNQTANFDTALSNIGGAPALTHRYYLYVREPNDANYIRLDRKDSADDFNPRTTIRYDYNYTFPRKGTYSFRAAVDPNHTTPDETDETNNDMIAECYVRGLEPNKPAKPTISGGQTLYRNNDYIFSTSGTDPDNDPLLYQFYLRRGETGQWYGCAWDPNTFTWHSNSMTYNFAGITRDVEGTYYLRAQSIDNDGLISELSDATLFEVAANTAPNTPDISAPDTAYTGDTISFTASTSDKENDWFAYRFNWGDGSPITDYYWPWPVRGSQTETHDFNAPGTYTVQVQAKDYIGAESPWSSHQITITNYVPPPDTSITVTTNNPAATFKITRGLFEYDGSGTRWTTLADPGSYTITFYDVNNYNTPSGSTKSLLANQNITFDGQYTHKTGTVQVTTNLGSASFTVTGHGAAKGKKFHDSGTFGGPWSTYAGDYTIAYDKVSGYCLPATNNELKTLNEGGTVTFDGRYVRPPVASLDVCTPGGFAVAGETAVQFDGSASYSPESDLHIAQYKFDFGDGEMHIEKDTDVLDPNLAADSVFDGNTVHVYANGGYYYAALWVSDQFGNMNTDYTSRVVRVKSKPRAYISAIDPQPAIAGETVSFFGRAKDPDGDAIIAYEWQSNIDGLLSNQKDFSTDRLTPGLHTISFRVEDCNNLWSEWTDKALIVYDALNWPMFKDTAPRLSNQGTYSGRLHGLLPYGSSVFYNAPGTTITGSPVAANLDGNSVNGLEVAFVSSAAGGGAGTLYVTNSTGVLKWSKNIMGASQSTPAIGDIDDDGHLDIVVRSNQGVYAYDCNGNSIYTFINPEPPFPAQPIESSPVIADIDANSANGRETVVGSADGRVYAIKRNGNQLWAFPAAPVQPFTSSPLVAELEPNSPGLETVIGGTDGTLYIIDSSGQLISSFMTGPNPIHTTPAIGDLVANMPGIEIVFGSDDGHLYCVNYSNRMLTLCWMYPTPPAALQPIRSSPAIGFVAYNPQTPPIVFGCDDGKVYVVRDNAGQPLLAGTFQCGAAVKSTPAIANIDSIHYINPNVGDQPEVIVGANDGKLYALSFAGGAGQQLPGSPFALTVGAPPPPVCSSPALADIDHSPDLEILIGANDGRVYSVNVQKNPAQVPDANFTGAPTSGLWPLNVAFTDQSLNTPLTWLWNFGDGYTSTQQNPAHTYSATGTYTVTLKASNAHGSNTITKNNYITVNGAPVADFTQSAAVGTIPFDVNFTDQSEYNPTLWSWTFGDGGTSNLQNPQHTYTTAGTYTVSLTAANGYGSGSITKTACILAKEPQPSADFTHDVNSGIVPLTVHFTDHSTGSPASWSWNFGDGGTSSQQNPSHIYNSPGSYLVSLTVSNSTGSDTKTNSVYIRVFYLADFDHSGAIDFKDFKYLVDDWLQSSSTADIAPRPSGDGIVDFKDFALLAEHWAGTTGP